MRLIDADKIKWPKKIVCPKHLDSPVLPYDGHMVRCDKCESSIDINRTLAACRKAVEQCRTVEGLDEDAIIRFLESPEADDLIFFGMEDADKEGFFASMWIRNIAKAICQRFAPNVPSVEEIKEFLQTCDLETNEGECFTVGNAMGFNRECLYQLAEAIHDMLTKEPNNENK